MKNLFFAFFLPLFSGKKWSTENLIDLEQRCYRVGDFSEIDKVLVSGEVDVEAFSDPTILFRSLKTAGNEVLKLDGYQCKDSEQAWRKVVLLFWLQAIEMFVARPFNSYVSGKFNQEFGFKNGYLEIFSFNNTNFFYGPQINLSCKHILGVTGATFYLSRILFGRQHMLCLEHQVSVFNIFSIGLRFSPLHYFIGDMSGKKIPLGWFIKFGSDYKKGWSF